MKLKNTLLTLFTIGISTLTGCESKKEKTIAMPEMSENNKCEMIRGEIKVRKQRLFDLLKEKERENFELHENLKKYSSLLKSQKETLLGAVKCLNIRKSITIYQNAALEPDPNIDDYFNYINKLLLELIEINDVIVNSLNKMEVMREEKMCIEKWMSIMEEIKLKMGALGSSISNAIDRKEEIEKLTENLEALKKELLSVKCGLENHK
ncbi:hypothetical protein HZA39_03770 [Candidatus Peregrinibacteria bacterium]|nr:hypothetical protein [Candidatus Peregrinibacteria bacterium]